MSKVVAPIPPMQLPDDWRPPTDSQWWRFRLLPNEDGHLYITQTDAPDATWMSWEFFDGEHITIDCGFDRPTCARLGEFESRAGGVIDVLHVGPPTPSPHWRPLTEPGDQRHPASRPCDCVCWKCLWAEHCDRASCAA